MAIVIRRRPERDLEEEEPQEEVQEAQPWGLRLYVAGDRPRSAEAILAVRTLCERFLQGRYELEIVDLLEQPQRARDTIILTLPCLVRFVPSPVVKVIGDIAENFGVLLAVELAGR